MSNPIDEAAAVYELAKMQHERTAEALSEAHANLVALMPTKDEGAVTIKGETYKVAITYGVNRTVDAAALEAIKSSVPAALFEQAITARPAKPSLKIEVVEAVREAA